MISDKKILNYKNIARKINKLKKNNKKIVFVTGCFDILHLGHVIFLEYAKSQGDVLVVGVGSDKTVRFLKGKSRPILNEKIRSRLLAALELVNFVIINKEKIIHQNIDHSILVSKIKPNIYVVPSTDLQLEQKKKLIEKNGGKLITCRRLPPNKLKGGISSTKILRAFEKDLS